jgi:hypothetical protein
MLFVLSSPGAGSRDTITVSREEAALLDRKVDAANLFDAPLYVVEQQGFRKIPDTTFMIGFLLHPDANVDDIKRYFRAIAARAARHRPGAGALQALLSQRVAGEVSSDDRCQRLWSGRALVFEPYTQEMFERTKSMDGRGKPFSRSSKQWARLRPFSLCSWVMFD